jgi:LPPG:FO 2-phospho-L-lactate transferase
VLDAWLLAEEDADAAASVAETGIRPVVAPLWMTDVDASAAIVEAALRA